LDYYQNLQQAYGWTIREIDETPLEVLLDQAAVMVKTSDVVPEQAYIEDVLP
jgi:hypothetical protein